MENTTWVTFKNEFFTEISSLNPQKPSRFNIEAIEDSELIVIDKKDMDFLYGYIAVWEEFGRKIWEAMSVRMINQIINFQTLSAEKRYLEFLNNPELLQKNPHQTVSCRSWHYTKCTKPNQEKYSLIAIIYLLVVLAIQQRSTFES